MEKSRILALSFDNDSIKYVEFEKKKKKSIIHNIGTKELPEDSCKSAYGIFDYEKVKTGLNELLDEESIKAKKATYLIPEKSVSKKTTTLPASSTDKEIYKLIKRNSKQYTGENYNDIYFDFYTHEHEKRNKKNVYIVAVLKEVVEERDNVIIDCGLEAQVADIPSICMSRLNHYVREKFYEENHQALLPDEFLVFFKKENHIYNATIYDYELKDTVQFFKDSLKEAVEEMKSIIEGNKMESKMGGFVFFDLKEEVGLDKEQYIEVSTLLDSKINTNSDVDLGSSDWYALSGLIQRERNEY